MENRKKKKDSFPLAAMTLELLKDKRRCSPQEGPVTLRLREKGVSKDVLKSPCFMLLFERWIGVEKGVDYSLSRRAFKCA
jgi:hypothetical protein